MSRTAFVLTALLIVGSTAFAQVHRCKDAAGNLHFSDRPCSAGQTGGLVMRQKSQEEIYQERMQAAEANERKYRSRLAEREQQMLDQQRVMNERAARPAQQPAQLAQTRECQAAKRELEFVSSLRTPSQDEKRMRTNAAITQVNAACGSNTALMQEPPKIINQTRPQTCIHAGGPVFSCH